MSSVLWQTTDGYGDIAWLSSMTSPTAVGGVCTIGVDHGEATLGVYLDREAAETLREALDRLLDRDEEAMGQRDSECKIDVPHGPHEWRAGPENTLRRCAGIPAGISAVPGEPLVAQRLRDLAEQAEALADGVGGYAANGTLDPHRLGVLLEQLAALVARVATAAGDGVPR